MTSKLGIFWRHHQKLATYTQLLHESSITQTGLGLTERVLLRGEAGFTTGLVAVTPVRSRSAGTNFKMRGERGVLLNTENLEASLGLGVDKVLALDLQRRQGSGTAG